MSWRTPGWVGKTIFECDSIFFWWLPPLPRGGQMSLQIVFSQLMNSSAPLLPASHQRVTLTEQVRRLCNRICAALLITGCNGRRCCCSKKPALLTTGRCIDWESRRTLTCSDKEPVRADTLFVSLSAYIYRWKGLVYQYLWPEWLLIILDLLLFAQQQESKAVKTPR